MKKPILALLLAQSALFAAAQNGQIWFDTPTASPRTEKVGAADAAAQHEWEYRSLPLGNGSIGCNVMGSVSTERYTLNEKTLWRGGPGTAKGPADYWNQNKESAHLLPAIRQAFLDGDHEKAARLTADNFNGPVPYEPGAEPQDRFGSYVTLGELRVLTDVAEEGIAHYRRSLSIDSATATVSFTTADGTVCKRTTFVSYPAQCLVSRFTATRPQTLAARYLHNTVSQGRFAADGPHGFAWTGQLTNNGMAYAVRLRVVAPGATITVTDSTLRIEGGRDVTFFLTADTDYAPNYAPDFTDPKAYVGVDPGRTTADWMKRAERSGYEKLLAAHLKDYAALFGRVTLHLEGPSSSQPTDRRLAAYREGQPDAGLETLYYQYGRYLLIASSRPGNLPANLQGIWHNNVDGPWNVDYHNNINLQMNYWPALTTNLSECAEPLTDFIRLLEKPGERTARAYWGARGWAAGISANVFGFTAPLAGRDMSWNYNPMAASWLATHLWEYYAFTHDEDFLRHTAYPLMRGCALFCEDFLWRKPDGTLTAAPSTSPEHGPVDEGTTFTHAVVRDILTDCIEAARTLGTDTADVNRWNTLLTTLAPYRIGRYGQLMEWSRDIDDPDDHHRHVNHLYGLHPGSGISPLTTPELARACRVVLEHRGDGATGWSMGWKLNQWARLHDGNHSYTLYGNLLKNGTADNLWDIHPPFQIDGNFGGTAGVTEMLLQSHAGCIDLLPALPDAWPSGSICGLRARGNFEVALQWNGGKLTQARIRSLDGTKCRVRYGQSTMEFSTRKNATYLLATAPDGSLRLTQPTRH